MPPPTAGHKSHGRAFTRFGTNTKTDRAITCEQLFLCKTQARTHTSREREKKIKEKMRTMWFVLGKGFIWDRHNNSGILWNNDAAARCLSLALSWEERRKIYLCCHSRCLCVWLAVFKVRRARGDKILCCHRRRWCRPPISLSICFLFFQFISPQRTR